jgi:hypothetical protein
MDVLIVTDRCPGVRTHTRVGKCMPLERIARSSLCLSSCCRGFHFGNCFQGPKNAVLDVTTRGIKSERAERLCSKTTTDGRLEISQLIMRCERTVLKTEAGL